MGLVRLMQAGSAQFLASALRQVPSSSTPDQAPSRFAEAVAGSSAWPASDAHVAAAKKLDTCLGDLQTRSTHGAIPCPCMHQPEYYLTGLAHNSNFRSQGAALQIAVQ